MKRTILVLAMLLMIGTAWAKDSTNPADYPLKAHLVSTETTRVHSSGTTSSYDYKTGKWTYGSGGGNSWSTTTEFQVGNLIYISSDVCRDHKEFLLAGTDYPARLEKGRLLVLFGDKVCKMHITGTREATPSAPKPSESK